MGIMLYLSKQFVEKNLQYAHCADKKFQSRIFFSSKIRKKKLPVRHFLDLKSQMLQRGS